VVFHDLNALALLQRYRTLGWLPFLRIDQKAYYKESDVKKFIEERANKKRRPPPG
jgi:hypothetical protein